MVCFSFISRYTEWSNEKYPTSSLLFHFVGPLCRFKLLSFIWQILHFRSDTESADGRPKDSKRGLIPVRLSNYFKKGKNKEETKNDEEEGKTEEFDPTAVPLDTTLATENEDNKGNKEGVVYAELDLISPPGVKAVVKNDNDKTEYAEILYTPKEEGQKEDIKWDEKISNHWNSREFKFFNILF